MSSLVFNANYTGRKVLVTGHTGFKGSWLSLWLHLLGAEIIGYALDPPTYPSLFKVLGLEKMIKHVNGNILDLPHLKQTINTYQPEIVFHLAAQPLVDYSYQQPVLTFATNIIGTVNTLEAVRLSSSVKVLINVTSDKCYENKEWEFAYRESDPLGGVDPYSSSKACAEIITASYRRSFFNTVNLPRIASVRSGNVIGGGDWSGGRIVPDCIQALQKDQPVIIRNPRAIRPWQHVLEPLSGYLWLASLLYEDTEGLASAWNFGPTTEDYISVQALVETVFEAWGSGSWQYPSNILPQFPEAQMLMLDSTRARNLLGWKTLLSVKTAINNTVAWYKEYQHLPREILQTTMDNINYYVAEGKKQKMPWAMPRT